MRLRCSSTKIIVTVDNKVQPVCHWVESSWQLYAICLWQYTINCNKCAKNGFFFSAKAEIHFKFLHGDVAAAGWSAGNKLLQRALQRSCSSVQTAACRRPVWVYSFNSTQQNIQCKHRCYLDISAPAFPPSLPHILVKVFMIALEDHNTRSSLHGYHMICHMLPLVTIILHLFDLFNFMNSHWFPVRPAVIVTVRRHLRSLSNAAQMLQYRQEATDDEEAVITLMFTYQLMLLLVQHVHQYMHQYTHQYTHQ